MARPPFVGEHGFISHARASLLFQEEELMI
jgi:hypothetical protein